MQTAELGRVVSYLLTHGTRRECINWLCIADRNGIWTDEDSEAEDREPLTLSRARQCVLDLATRE
jgi:hypothetical protein